MRLTTLAPKTEVEGYLLVVNEALPLGERGVLCLGDESELVEPLPRGDGVRGELDLSLPNRPIDGYLCSLR